MSIEPSLPAVRCLPSDMGARPRSVVAARTALSLLRRAVPRLAVPGVDIGGVRILADLTTPFGLYLYREGFPQPEARLLRSLLRPGDVFIDGGAHVGTFSLIAATLVGPTGRVIACEPSQGARELLERNLKLNRLRNVDVLPLAIAEAPGQLQFLSFDPNSALSSFAPANRNGGRTTLVDVECLDAIARPHLARVRVVKLDIEGAEVRALRGAKDLLAARPDFVIEVEPQHLARQGSTVEDLQTIFQAAGYVGYEILAFADRLELHPVETWARPSGNPNLFVSAGEGS